MYESNACLVWFPMHHTNLRAIDLNLLLVLDALLQERSVTRAAGRLHLSQPAVSHALDRLRALFRDPLLERRGTQMVPTQRATELSAQLGRVLTDIQQLVDLPQTPLAQRVQTVRVAMADYPCAVLLPALWTRLQKQAPGISLVCQNWLEGPRELERLQRGDTDLALSLFGDVPDDICKEKLGVEHYIGVARRRHPLGRTPTLDAFCRYPHVLVSAVGGQRSQLDGLLAAHGHTRRVAVSVGSFLTVPSLIAASDAVALVPRSLAQLWPPAQGLMRFTPPLPPPPFDIHLGYHRRRADDPGVMAVARCLRAVCRATLRTKTAR